MAIKSKYIKDLPTSEYSDIGEVPVSVGTSTFKITAKKLAPVRSFNGRTGDIELTTTDVEENLTGHLNQAGDPHPQYTLKVNSGQVLSVQTKDANDVLSSKRVGDILITRQDFSIENVDNTSDANKPISLDQQNALDGKEPTFTKNSAFNKNFGGTVDTVTEGNDSRLSDARTPTAHDNTYHSTNYEAAGEAATLDTAHVTLDHNLQTGNYDIQESTLTWVDGTRTFSIAPAVTDFSILIRGVKTTFAVSQSTVIPNTIGIHFIYFDETGTLVSSLIPWNIKAADKVFVATIGWNGTIGAVGDERHGIRDLAWHDWAHHTIGTRYESGLSMISPTAVVDNKLSFNGGTLHDEDIDINLIPTVRGRLFYNLTADTYSFENLVDNAGNDYPFRWNATTSRVQFMTTGFVWQDVAASDYMTYYYYASNDISDRWIYAYTQPILAAFNTSAEARTSPPVASFSPELKLLYRIIFDGAGNYIESTDYRTSSTLPSGGTTATTASAVTVTPIGGITATTVQSALEELDARLTAHAI